MKAGVLKITRDRKTGKKISEVIEEVIDIDEDEYYGPLVKLLGNDFLKNWKIPNEKVGGQV